MKRSSTELGKFLKKLRVDKEESLSVMAEKLDVSSSFLSAVEVGKKPLPDKMYNKIIETYSLEDTQREQEFYAARSVTNNAVEVKLTDINKNENEALSDVEKERNEVALSFGWKFLNLSPEQINKIKDILEEGGNIEE